MALIAGLAAPLVLAAPAAAAQSKCLVGKNKCVSKLVPALLKCHQTAQTPGKAPDPNHKGCIDKALAKFDGGAAPDKGCFRKLELKSGNDCLTFMDTPALQAAALACVDAFVAEVDPPPAEQSKCGAGKKKCIATRAAGRFKCYQKAQTPGKPEDPADSGCLAKVDAKFDGGPDVSKGCFAKLEAKNGNDCLPPLGNTAEAAALVDACVDSLLGQLESGGTTSTTTTSPPTTSTTTTTSTTSPPTTSTTTTTSTTAPPTTSTTSTTTSSTTTTTVPALITCGPNGLDVTGALDYEPRITGGVFGLFYLVNYPPAVSLPGSGTASSVRARFTNLIGATNYRLTGSDVDTNGDTIDDQARTLISANSTIEVPSAPLQRVRFDCAAGTQLSPAQFSCGLTDLVDSSGQLFAPEVAALISCSLSFSVP